MLLADFAEQQALETGMFQYSSSESFKCSIAVEVEETLPDPSFSTLHLSRSNAP